MKFELSRSENGHHVNDAELSVSFDDTERLLLGRAFMRPTLRNDLQRPGSYILPDNTDFSRLSYDWSQLKRELAYDMRLKRHYLRQSVAEPVSAVADYYTNEAGRKWRQMSYSFDRMYRANEFYMRDIYQALERLYNDLRLALYFLTEILKLCRHSNQKITLSDDFVSSVSGFNQISSVSEFVVVKHLFLL